MHLLFTGSLFNHACVVEFTGSFELCTTVRSCNWMRRPSGSCRNIHVPLNLTCFIFQDNVLLSTMCNTKPTAWKNDQNYHTWLSILGKQIAQLVYCISVAWRTLMMLCLNGRVYICMFFVMCRCQYNLICTHLRSSVHVNMVAKPQQNGHCVHSY